MTYIFHVKQHSFLKKVFKQYSYSHYFFLYSHIYVFLLFCLIIYNSRIISPFHLNHLIYHWVTALNNNIHSQHYNSVVLSPGYINIQCRAFHVISLESLRLLYIIFTRVDAASVCLISRSLYLPLVKFIGFVLFSVTLIKMDPCESNCHMIRLLFGACLSEINQYTPF